jgi:hypothetical protein
MVSVNLHLDSGDIGWLEGGVAAENSLILSSIVWNCPS